MSELMVDIRKLEYARSQLAEMRQEGTREVARLMALAECNFRLSVHADTTSQQAITLLEEAIKIDGANPKFAYHLGRIHFQRREYAAAARWLRLACCLAPTSHRVWTHVAILLQELNEVYRGDENYEPNVLLQRSEKIAEAIQAGKDQIDPDLIDFVPPISLAAREKEARRGYQGKSATPSPNLMQTELRPSAEVRRYLHAKKCRWSGIDHLIVERILRGRPTQANVRTMAPILQRLATTATRRPGGPAAVAILLVQWVASGYPLETVHRLMQELPQDLPSWELLDTVCRLFEAPIEEVPAMIAQAADRGQLPPLLAALIHRQRLLWQSLEFRSFSACRAARTLVSEAKSRPAETPESESQRADAARDVTRRLDQVLSTLRASPPKPLKDEVPQHKKQAGSRSSDLMCSQLDALEAASLVLDEVRAGASETLRESLEPASNDPANVAMLAQAAVDAACFQSLLADLQNSGESGLQQLDALGELVASTSAADLPHDCDARMEASRNRFRAVMNIGTLQRRLQRIHKKLDGVNSPRADQLAPGQPLQQLRVRLDSAFREPAAPEPENEANSLETWLQESATLQQQMSADWDILKSSVVRLEDGPLEEDDLQQLGELRGRFNAALQCAQQRINDISVLRQSGTCSAADIEVLDISEQQYLQVLKVRGKFQKNFARLPELKMPPKPAADQEPAAGSIAAAAPPQPESKPGKPRREPAPPKTAEELTPCEQLEYTLVRVNWAVKQVFADSLATFDAYPRWLRESPPFEALQRQIVAQQAETTYRLGQRRRARALWNQMLRTNRLNASALKNIAVCDTMERDVANTLTSWREYVELLYLFDVFSGDPSDHADVRAEFHRAFGNAFAPTFLSAPLTPDWSEKVESAALISFLSSPGRFRSYINHRLLEYLNTRFQFQSPSLTLGIKRVECEAQLENAQKEMVGFVQLAGQLLTGRAAGRFVALAESTLKQAADRCRRTSQLTLQATPLYNEEEQRQVKMLARLYDVKLKLVMAFNEHVNMVKNISSLDFLNEVARLDAIPLKISPGLLPIVASTMQVTPELLEGLTETLRGNVIASLLKYLLEDDDPAEHPTRMRQYELLTGKWLREAEFRQFARIVDAPFSFMPKDVVDAISGERLDQALPHLRRWHDYYPAMANIAVLIANHLFKQQGFKEARERLERSRLAAIFGPTKRHINFLLIQIILRDLQRLIDEENYMKALSLSLEAIALDDFNAGLVKQTLQLFTVVAQQHGKRVFESELEVAVRNWIARAQEVATVESEDDSLPRPTTDNIEDVRTAFQATIGRTI